VITILIEKKNGKIEIITVGKNRYFDDDLVMSESLQRIAKDTQRYGNLYHDVSWVTYNTSGGENHHRLSAYAVDANVIVGE